MTFNAKYPGRCGDCGERFDVGDFIKYNGPGLLVHSDCEWAAVTMDDFTLGPRETICPDCYTIHAGECA